MTMPLAISYTAVAANSATQSEFILQFKSALATLLSIDSSRIDVLRVSPHTVGLVVEYGLYLGAGDSRNLLTLGEELKAALAGGLGTGLLTNYNAANAVITNSLSECTNPSSSIIYPTSTGTSNQYSGAATNAPGCGLAFAIASTLVAAVLA
jgi:hypothetical protein